MPRTGQLIVEAAAFLIGLPEGLPGFEGFDTGNGPRATEFRVREGAAPLKKDFRFQISKTEFRASASAVPVEAWPRT